MKTKIKIIFLVIMLYLGACITSQKASAQGGYVDFQVFYNELSPYGTWVENPDYGYVWIPNVGPGFTPYATNGYWVFTVDGWTWVSNYPWGWAPFHYGRWYTDPIYGPIWVPDNDWGPGWVTWRRSAGYYGWAPIGPGISINIAYSNDYNVPYNQWTFVRDRHFGRRDINNYYVNSSNNVTIINNNSTVIYNIREDKTRNVRYNPGPDRTEVEKRVGKTFTPIPIRESSKPGQHLSKDQLQIYRPQVQKTVSTGPKPAPSRVATLKEVKPAAQRTAGTPQQKVNQPTKQQPSQQQRQAQPTKQQPKQQQQAQPTKQQPKQQQQAQPTKQQQPKQQQQAQPTKQQQPKQQQQVQPTKQQQPKQQQQAQPTKQQQPKQQRQAQPPKKQSSEPQQTNPPKKVEKEKESQQEKPPKNMGE